MTNYRCPGVSRRSFLVDTGMGFTGLALGAMLFKDGVARAADQASMSPARPAKAKSVIWLFLCGGVSHLESFDPKPELTKYDGKSISDTPYTEVLDDKRVNRNLVGINPSHGNRKTLMKLQTPFQRYGESGLAVGDWFKHIGECADDLAVVRSLWTIHNDHGTQLTWHTGRHPREGSFPTIGSWISYGLGTSNQNLPEYVVLGQPTGDCCGGEWTHGAGYLGPEHAGVRLDVGSATPLPYVSPAGGGILAEEQAATFSLLGRLNQLSGIDYPDDAQLRARIKSYELAFGMQTAVPETLDLHASKIGRTSLIWAGPGHDSTVWSIVLGGPATRRTRCAIRASVSRRWRRRGLGRSFGDRRKSLEAVGPSRQTDRWFAEGFEASRNARRNTGCLGHRIRPLARSRRKRPRSSSQRLLCLARRRRH